MTDEPECPGCAEAEALSMRACRAQDALLRRFVNQAGWTAANEVVARMLAFNAVANLCTVVSLVVQAEARGPELPRKAVMLAFADALTAFAEGRSAEVRAAWDDRLTSFGVDTSEDRREFGPAHETVQ